MPPTPIIRKPLLTAALSATRPLTEVHAAEVTLGPGRATGRHFHSMPVVGYVTAGTIHFQIEGQPSRTLVPGHSFLEPPGVTMAHFDNVSPTEPATFIAFYLKGPSDDALIEMLPPAPCP